MALADVPNNLKSTENLELEEQIIVLDFDDNRKEKMDLPVLNTFFVIHFFYSS